MILNIKVTQNASFQEPFIIEQKLQILLQQLPSFIAIIHENELGRQFGQQVLVNPSSHDIMQSHKVVISFGEEMHLMFVFGILNLDLILDYVFRWVLETVRDLNDEKGKIVEILEFE